MNELIKKNKIHSKSRILLVNDGSRDSTWEIICDLAKNNAHFCGISQSRNRGHQNAVLAGLMEARELCDITISIDCDGQDDIDAMDRMIDAYCDGCEVVYGVRNRRDTDTWFKRFSAEGFYKFMNWMGAEVIFNHADYRLVSSKVLKELADFKEVNIFLRGMIPLVGFNSTSVYYERQERLAGKSHYTLKKNAGSGFRRDYQPEYQANPDYNRYWFVYCRVKLCGSDLVYHHVYGRENCQRMVQYDLYCLFYRRSPAD